VDCIVAKDEASIGGCAIMRVDEGFRCVFSCEAGAHTGVAWVEDDGGDFVYGVLAGWKGEGLGSFVPPP